MNGGLVRESGGLTSSQYTPHDQNKYRKPRNALYMLPSEPRPSVPVPYRSRPGETAKICSQCTNAEILKMHVQGRGICACCLPRGRYVGPGTATHNLDMIYFPRRAQAPRSSGNARRVRTRQRTHGRESNISRRRISRIWRAATRYEAQGVHCTQVLRGSEKNKTPTLRVSSKHTGPGPRESHPDPAPTIHLLEQAHGVV